MQNEQSIFDKRRFDELDAVAPPPPAPDEHPFESYFDGSVQLPDVPETETFEPLFTAQPPAGTDPAAEDSGEVGEQNQDESSGLETGASEGDEPSTSGDPEIANDEAEQASPAAVIDEEQLEAARQAAFEEGRTAGRAEAEAETASLSAKALQEITEHLASIGENHTAEFEQASADALSIGVALVRKLFPTLKTKLAEKEIRAFVAQRLGDAGDAKMLKVQVNESVSDTVTAQMSDLAKQSGFGGAITVQADPDLAVGDVRLDWRDGGVERVYETLWTGLEAALFRSIGPLEPSEKAAAARPQKKAQTAKPSATKPTPPQTA